MTLEPQQQLARFRDAVDLLGGPRSAARALAITERHMGRLYSGASPLHAGFLADIGAALLAHAEACKTLERQLSPAFTANLVEGQGQRPKPRGRWAGKEG